MFHLNYCHIMAVQVVNNLLMQGSKLGKTLEELRAVDDGGMNALHWAAGRDADGSVEAAKVVLEAERSLLARLDTPKPSKETSRASGEIVAQAWSEDTRLWTDFVNKRRKLGRHSISALG